MRKRSAARSSWPRSWAGTRSAAIPRRTSVHCWSSKQECFAPRLAAGATSQESTRSGTPSRTTVAPRRPPIKWNRGRLDFERTLVMGILNVTPDSFSDGGKFLGKEAALHRALQMVEEGADIIDIGGESTRPGAEEIAPEEELERIMPLIRELVPSTDALISIDTRHWQVAQEALANGVDMINDVSGLREPEDDRARCRDRSAGHSDAYARRSEDHADRRRTTRT